MTHAAPVRFQRVLLAALMAGIVALAVADWQTLASSPDADVEPPKLEPTPTRAPTALPQVESPAIAPPQPESYEAILERPLFDVSRRPPPVVVAKPAPPPPKAAPAAFPADKLRLVGVMRSPGKPPQALVRTNLNDPGLWFSEGAMVGDWRVERVGEDKVDFSSNGATGVLKMVPVQAIAEIANSAATGPAAAPAAAAATVPPAGAHAAVPAAAPAAQSAKK